MAKAIVNHNLQVVDSYNLGGVEITVYDDGTVCYRNLESGRSTAFDIRDARYYRISDKDSYDGNDDIAEWLLCSYAENRIENNTSKNWYQAVSVALSEDEIESIKINRLTNINPKKNKDMIPTHKRNPFPKQTSFNPVEEASFKKWEKQYLQDALIQLSPIQRQVIVLYYIEELSEREIAERLGTKRSKVQYHRNKGLEILIKILETVF